MEGHLSPTNIAVYHHNQCQLYLHNAYHRPHELNESKPTAQGHATATASGQTVSPLAAAQFQRGLDWEERLFHILESMEQLIRIDNPEVPKSADDLRAIILKATEDEDIDNDDENDDWEKIDEEMGEDPVLSIKYISNLTFISPNFDRELQQYGSPPGSVTFGMAKPDLVKISNHKRKIVWEIIDAKASASLKSSHNAQIGFYHICLENLLANADTAASNEIKGRKIVPSEHVSVWLPNPKDMDDLLPPVPTPVSLLLPSLRIFLFKNLPQILNQPRDQVEWHLNPSCHGCDFWDSCKSQTINDRRLGLIPNLSTSEGRFIREVLGLAEANGILDKNRKLKTAEIEDLDLLVKSPDFTRLEKTYSATMKRFQRVMKVQRTQTRRWSPAIEAAMTRKPQLARQRVFTLPRSEEIAIYISVIIDVSNNNTIGAWCASASDSKAYNALQGLVHVAGTAQNFVGEMAGFIDKVLRKNRTNKYKGDSEDEDAYDLSSTPAPRTQVYTYNPAERTAIVNHLIQVALDKDTSEETNKQVRICLGALCEGTSVLLTDFQPKILSDVLLSFLSKRSLLSKKQLQLCCERLNLKSDGSVEVLRTRIEAEQKRLAELGGRAGDDLSRREVGQLSKIVVLKRETELLISLPIPGFVDLPQTVDALLGMGNANGRGAAKPKCETDDALFAAWQQSPTNKGPWEASLKERNRCMRAVVGDIRRRISAADLTERILLNEAKPLEVGMIDICESDKLRKLLFMLQFEVVLRLQALWQDRLEGCPNAPLLRYVRSDRKGTHWNHTFDVVGGTVEPRLEDRAFYDWLLVAETEVENKPDSLGNVPPEIYFDDLAVSGLVFPLTKYTRPRWDQQLKVVRDEVFIANVEEVNVVSDGGSGKLRTQATLQTFYTGKMLERGKLYRISPRYVDFNLNKVLLNLVLMDFEATLVNETVPFINLIDDPIIFSNSPSFGEDLVKHEKKITTALNELAKLDNNHAKALILKSSQERAARRMIMKRLSVVWGPPGTGKTYTLALSTLKMIELLQLDKKAPELCSTILVTAMTHAAIDAVLVKMKSLIEHYRQLEAQGRAAPWLDIISLERVFNGGTHAPPGNKKVHIYAGTTFQLYKFCDRAKFKANMIIIDEAGQLALGTAALVIRWLADNGKLVLAGDHQQLAPILGAEYPEKETDLPLFGSILDHLMGGGKHRKGLTIVETLPSGVSQDTDPEAAVVQLLENFRLNEDMGMFVERIYARRFKPSKEKPLEIAESLQLWLDTADSDDPDLEQARQFLLELSNAMMRRATKLSPPRSRMTLTQQKPLTGQARVVSLALIRVRPSKLTLLPYEAHVKAEARLAAALVHWLRESFGDEESIFVACPHRIQRSAVRQAITSPRGDFNDDTIDPGNEDSVDNLAEELRAFHLSETGLRIDTVERLQGSEASFVIFLLSHTHTPSLSDHLPFLLARRRLNVGISRAKALCILVSSRGVLQPSLNILSNKETRQGLQFLRDYEDRAWIGDIELNV